jgi:hypothetical protein
METKILIETKEKVVGAASSSYASSSTSISTLS